MSKSEKETEGKLWGSSIDVCATRLNEFDYTSQKTSILGALIEAMIDVHCTLLPYHNQLVNRGVSLGAGDPINEITNIADNIAQRAYAEIMERAANDSDILMKSMVLESVSRWQSFSGAVDDAEAESALANIALTVWSQDKGRA